MDATAEPRVGTLAALAMAQSVVIVLALRGILPVVTGRRAVPAVSGGHHASVVSLPAPVSQQEWVFLCGLAGFAFLVTLPGAAAAAAIARHALVRLGREPGSVTGRVVFAATAAIAAAVASVPVSWLAVTSAGARQQPALVTVLGTGGTVLRWCFPLVLLFGVTWLVRATREEEKKAC